MEIFPFSILLTKDFVRMIVARADLEYRWSVVVGFNRA